jgi:hypothetical protein
VKRDDFEVGREDGWNGVLMADFLLQQSLDANAVLSKATDRQWGRESKIKNLSSVSVKVMFCIHALLLSYI